MIREATFKGRPVEFEFHVEIGEGAYIDGGIWADTGADLSDQDIDVIQDILGGELYQDGYESMAADAYDRAKDRRKYGDD